MYEARALARSEMARHIWQMRYRHGAEASVEQSLHRVARALAAPERRQAAWSEAFLSVMRHGLFLPGGRILAGAGTGRGPVTLFNCFVMGAIDDTPQGLQRALEEGAATLRQGGGIGYDLSTLGAGSVLPFLHRLEAMSEAMSSISARRGAMMGTLRCDHPDIEAFIDAKRLPGALSHFNLSVLVSDALLEAVATGSRWRLVDDKRMMTAAISATALWTRLMRAAYDSTEPGVLFIDRINRLNNLGYCEHISATNPCGEIPLPPYGACDLGSLNLTAFVRAPFAPRARIDHASLTRVARIGTRMLDNVIDISPYPLVRQGLAAHACRRIGLGLMGLADALVMLGLPYDSAPARLEAARAMRTICHAAYAESISLGAKKGVFPAFDGVRYPAMPFIAALPDRIRARIARHGLRNSHLTAIAPTGSISLLADQVSSGLEPIFAPATVRDIQRADGTMARVQLTAFSVRLWRALGKPGLPPAFRCAQQIAPEDQLEMQAALQPFVDNAISKTLSVPTDCAFANFEHLYEQAMAHGLKGCTVYRPQSLRPALLKARPCGMSRDGSCPPDDQAGMIPSLSPS